MAGGDSQDDALFLFRDSPLRRAALAASPNDPVRYSLYGADELARRGHQVAIRLARAGGYPRIYHWPGYFCDRLLRRRSWSSGLFAAAFSFLTEIRRVRIVVSTVDSIGIPLLWMKRWGLFKTPLIYISVGFPERLAAMPPEGQGVYRDLLGLSDVVIAFGYEESLKLKEFLGVPFQSRVRFIPFGAHTGLFSLPRGDVSDGPDVLSVGADPMRDFQVILRTAELRPDWKFELTASAEHASRLTRLPQNVRLSTDMPFTQTLERMNSARVVALPVRENSYSGATTTLLQAMALGRATVVSRVGAIRDGYGFIDHQNLRWVESNDPVRWAEILDQLMSDDDGRLRLGQRAQAHAATSLSWQRFTDAIGAALAEVSGGKEYP